MKSLLILLTISILLKVELCYSQWTNVSTSNMNFCKKVKFRNESEGFIIGYYGIILKSTDGGNTWNEINDSINLDIIDFQFINDTCIYAYSTNFMTKSENSGLSWSILDTLPTYTSKVLFMNSNIGFVCGGDGIFKSTDYGMSWTTVWNFSDGAYGFGSINDIIFLNDSIGFACGLKHLTGGGMYGIILKSADSGNSWEEVYNNSPWGSEILQIKIIDNVIYGINERGNLLKSFDIGMNWEEINTNLDSVITTLNEMYFLNADTSFVVTSPSVWIPEDCYSVGKIVRTTDGWQTFTTQYISEIYPCVPKLLNSIEFINDSIGFAVGYGLFLKTTNSGGDINLIDTSSGGINIERINKNKSGIKIFPNPAENFIIIETSSNEVQTIEIINIFGKVQYNDILYNNRKIDITDFKDGVYILRVKNNNKTEIIKFVKIGK